VAEISSGLNRDRGHFRGILRSYGVLGALRLARDIVLTRLTFPAARIVRRPLYVRGRHLIRVGEGLTTGVGLRLDAFDHGLSGGPLIVIGRHAQINDYVHIAAILRVEIGDDALLASKIFITDHNHGRIDGAGELDGPDTPPAQRPEAARAVVIGDRVWIGEGAVVLPGVTIGDGCIIGANAVVTADIPADSIAAGNPARVLRRYDRGLGAWVRTLTG
jgi:lipopolysaccharide O-acetyltransferase